MIRSINRPARPVKMNGGKRIAALVLSVMMLAVFLLTGVVNEAADSGARNGSMVPLTGFGGAEYYKKTNYYVNIYGDNGEIVEVRLRSGGSCRSCRSGADELKRRHCARNGGDCRYNG